MTNGKRRLMSLFLLGLCLVLIAVIGFQMVVGVRANRVIEYGGPATMQANPPALCPGETFTFEQSIHVAQTAMVTVSREWCNRGFTCNLDLHQSWPNVVLTPLDFSGTVTRTVPISPFFTPGLYEFRSGVKNGSLSVQIVEFSIRDDCEAKQ